MLRVMEQQVCPSPFAVDITLSPALRQLLLERIVPIFTFKLNFVFAVESDGDRLVWLAWFTVFSFLSIFAALAGERVDHVGDHLLLNGKRQPFPSYIAPTDEQQHQQHL